MHPAIVFAPVIAIIAILFGGGNLGGMRNALRQATDSLEKRPGE